MTAHWGIEDPAAVEDNEKEIAIAFAEACRVLGNRISLFASLPLEYLGELTLRTPLDEIGKAN